MPYAWNLIEVNIRQVDCIMEVIAVLGLHVLVLLQVWLVDGVDHATFHPTLNAKHQEEIFILIDDQPIIHAHDSTHLTLHWHHLILLKQCWWLPEVALQYWPYLRNLPEMFEHCHVFIS